MTPEKSQLSSVFKTQHSIELAEIVLPNLACIIAVIAAGVLALYGITGWGWFLFASLFLRST